MQNYGSTDENARPIRTLKQTARELKRRGIAKITPHGVAAIERRALRKLAAALAKEGGRDPTSV